MENYMENGSTHDDREEKEIQGMDLITKTKEKYGSIYQLSHTVEPDDETSIEKKYLFKRPKTGSYDRYVKMISQSPTKASRAFALDNIIDEQRAALEVDFEDYPAIAIGIADKLLAMLGLGKDTALKKL